MKLYSILIAAFWVFSPNIIADPLFPETHGDWEDCNFSCDKIPPLNISLVSSDPNQIIIEEKSTNKFNLLVWNIYKGRKDNFLKDYQRLSKNADIILLQEFMLTNEMLSLFDQNYQWDMGVSFIHKNVPTGVINGSKFSSNNVEIFRSPDKEPFVKTNKMTVANYYQLPNGEELLVINIHGINFKRKKGMMRHVRVVEDLITQHDGPIIYAGDFNTKTKWRRNSLDKYLSEFNLKKIEWPDDDRSNLFTLDHVYFRGLEVNKKVLDQSVEGSDHPALLVEFEAIP